MSVIKVILICQFTVLSFLFYLHLHCLCPTLHHTVFLIIPKYVYLQAGYGFFKIRKMQRAECMKLQIFRYIFHIERHPLVHIYYL